MPRQDPITVQTADNGRGGLPGATNHDLWGLIRFSHIFGSAVRELLEVRVLEEAGADHLSLPQLHLLQLITLNGSHQIGQVADFLGVSPPAATKNVDKLESLGLVTRTPSERDRRATLLASSAEGRRLVERFQTLKLERLEPVLAEFSAAELLQLESLLERFSTALVRSEEGVEGLCLRCSAYFDASCPIRHFHHGCPYQRLLTSESRPTGPPEA